MSKFTPRRRTRAQYDAIPVKDPDIFYIVLETDETFSLYLGEEPLKTSIGGGGGLTPEQEAKLNLIKDNGVGDKYLADDGNYKVVSGGGYAPDEDTIVLNENDELEATNVIIWGYE